MTGTTATTRAARAAHETTPYADPGGIMTATTPSVATVAATATSERLRRAVRRVAPVWPLDRFVAVNPYAGLADRSFPETAALLARVAGARGTLPAQWYLDAVAAGRVDVTDIEAALAGHGAEVARDAHDLLARAAADATAREPAAVVPTVADVAAACTGTDWPHLVTDRISAWAAAYFDAGQALWRSADPDDAPFAAWRFEAAIDRTPEVMGLRGFRAFVRSLPRDPHEAAARALGDLAIPPPAVDDYLHALARRAGGWLAHAARLGFEAELAGDRDDTAVELLAIALCWEQGLARCVPAPGFELAWGRARHELDRIVHAPAPPALARRVVLHEAFERAEQRRLARRLAGGGTAARAATDRPEVQAVFCIDVRSEVFRRHLEGAAPAIATLGFAGFFGFPVAYAPAAATEPTARCPVLLTPAVPVGEIVPGARGTTAEQDATFAAARHRRLVHHVRRAWKSFKMGAVSCFSFVGPVGLAYLPKLFTDAWGRTRPVPAPDRDGLPRAVAHSTCPDVGSIPAAERVELAAGALRGMSLTGDLAPLVLLCGHGATSVNNPYDSGLACGACGGFAGDVNARVAATVLNDPDVRAALAARGIVVPDSTWFVAARHDTTTDEVTCYDLDAVPANHRERVARLTEVLAEAGRRTRSERAARMWIGAESADREIARRSRDWAQVRPEWGLAGCRAFVAAPRSRSEGLDLEGRVFLHSYDWRRDEGFAVLELIMTAPMVVATWITLQYFGSTVDNDLFGSGNKTLHNVVGRLGVFEGTAGDLRTGLPWQAVHDGERLQHEPLRLTVVIEAPTDAMSGVLAAHPEVRELCDNGWVHLFAMDGDGRVTKRYAGDLRWEEYRA